MDAYNLIWNALQQVQIGYATSTAEGAEKLVIRTAMLAPAQRDGPKRMGSSR